MRQHQIPPNGKVNVNAISNNDQQDTSTNNHQQWTPHRLLTSSYRSLGPPAYVHLQFQNYLLSSPQTLTSLLSILLSEPAGKTGIFDYSLQIDMHDFISHDAVLGNMLLRHSETLLPLLEEAILSSQREILKRWNDFVGLVRTCYLCSDLDGDDNENGDDHNGNTQLQSELQLQQKEVQNNNVQNYNDALLQNKYTGQHLKHLPSSILSSMLLSSALQNNTSNNNNNYHHRTPIIKGENGTRVHARLIHLPPHYTNCKPSLSSLSSNDVGKILQISGTVVRTSKVQMYESQRAYRCGNGGDNHNNNNKTKKENNGCGKTFVIKADLQQWNNALNVPSRCPEPSCKNKNFVLLKEGLCRSDYQEIKLQESISNNGGSGSSGGGGGGNNSVASSIPKTLLIKLQHDLVDQCQPGDDVVVVGTLISHWMNNLVQMGDVQIGMAMDAHSIRVSNGGGGYNHSGGGNGSSWDCIFNTSNIDDDDDDDYEDEENDEYNHIGVNKKGKKRKRGGTIRDDIIQQFEDYWNDDMNKNRPIAARNFICQAVCPTLYGLSLVKMALLLVLIGGSSDTTTSSQFNENSVDQDVTNGVSSDNDHQNTNEGDEEDNENHDYDENDVPVQFSLGDDSTSTPIQTQYDSKPSSSSRGAMKRRRRRENNNNNTVHTRRREQSHLLIVGDPGCGKSQFLKFATALCPRSVFASGSGTTSAGLTCAAVRDEGSKEWTLEAGALVLADRGVCAIDEFSCINPKDRTTIHEAMEQQTLSVAKAGIIAKLNCRATVIAVTNAKSGYYDHDKSFSVNVGIEPPLLSRFDLIFKLIDGSDAHKDDNIATFLLNRAIMVSVFNFSSFLMRCP